MSNRARLFASASILAMYAFATTPASGAIETVVVTATRTPTPIGDVPLSVTVVSLREIRASAGQELDDILRTTPGVDLMGYAADSQHPTSNSLGMRGLGGGAQGISRALVLVDGIPINDPFFGYVQWSRAPLDNIDRVEVVRGGGSPLWGNYAEGGVINIVTRTPAGDGAGFDVGGGSDNTYRAAGWAAYRLDDNNVLQGFASANGTGGYQQVPAYERTPFNVPSSLDALNLRIRDTIAVSDDLSAHVTVDYHANHQRLETLLDTNSQQNVNLSGDIAKQFGSSSLALTLFYGHSDFGTNNATYFPNQFDLPSTTQDLNEIHHVRADNFGGSLIWHLQSDGLLKDAMVGADWHTISGLDHTEHFFAPDFSPSHFMTQGGGDQLFVAGFGQLVLAPTATLTVTGSARVQYLRNSHGFDGSVGGFGAIAAKDYVSFDPRLNLRYAVSPNVALRGAYYQSFRAPNISDLFYTYAAGGFAQLPAPFLKPEKLRGGEIGLDYTRENVRAQLTLYRTDINNYIVAEGATNPIYTPFGWYLVQNQNVAKVLAQGVEVELDWDIGSGFSTRLEYTFADSTVRRNPLDPLSEGKQIIDVPRNKAGGSLTYAAPSGWRLSAEALYVSRTAWASAEHVDPGYPGALSADPHFIMNLSGSYPVYDNVEAYVQLQNIFDRRFIATGYSAPSAQTYGTPFEAFVGLRTSIE